MDAGPLIVLTVAIIVGAVILYWVIYLAVKDAIRDARQPEVDHVRTDRPLVQPPGPANPPVD